MARNADLVEKWSEISGDDERETRQRVRLLFNANLLPPGRMELSHWDISRWLIARLGSATHKDAAETVNRYYEMPARGPQCGSSFIGETGEKLGDFLVAMALFNRDPKFMKRDRKAKLILTTLNMATSHWFCHAEYLLVPNEGPTEKLHEFFGPLQGTPESMRGNSKVYNFQTIDKEIFNAIFSIVDIPGKPIGRPRFSRPF